MDSGTPPADVQLDAAGCIGQDLPCIHCGYNLRGISAEAACPECGTLLSRSLRGEQLVFADPGWLEQLASGMNWMVAGLLTGIPVAVIGALIAAAIGTAATRLGQPDSIWQILLSSIGGLIWLVGYWKVTTPDPRGLEAPEALSARKIARVTLVANYLLGLGGGLMLAGLAKIGGAVLVVSFAGLGVIGGILGLIGWFALFVYARQLALRIPDAKLAGHTRIVMWGLAVTLLLGIVSGLGLALSLSTGASGVAVGLGGPMCLVGVGYLVFGLWSLNLMVRYRRRILGIARQAKVWWSAEPAAAPTAPAPPRART